MALRAIQPQSIKSIQGEQQDTKRGIQRADDEVVAEYIAGASDGVATCRERGRHTYAPTRRGKDKLPVFTDVSDDGYLVARKPCLSCGLVWRVEYWRAFIRGACTEVEMVDARPDYRTGPNGERYTLKPGHGRITPRQAHTALVRDAVGTKTPAQLMAEARKIGSEHANVRNIRKPAAS